MEKSIRMIFDRAINSRDQDLYVQFYQFDEGKIGLSFSTKWLTDKDIFKPVTDGIVIDLTVQDALDLSDQLRFYVKEQIDIQRDLKERKEPDRQRVITEFPQSML